MAISKRSIIDSGAISPSVSVVSDGFSVQETVIPTKGILGLTGAEVARDKLLTVKVTPAQIPQETVKDSEQSRTVFHSTLFNNFRLEASSTYNFFTEDEEKTYPVDESISLQDLPRYVTLTWRPAPRGGSFSYGQKGVRQFMNDGRKIIPAVEFDVARKSAANGFVAPGTINAIITAAAAPPRKNRIDEETFLLDPKSAGDFAARHVGDDRSKFAIVSKTQAEPIRVNFVDPSIVGALDAGRLSVASDDLDLSVAASFAKMVSGLEILSEFNQDVPTKNPVPVFPARVDSPVLMYIGYVIERYDMLPDGTMRLGRTIEIDDPGIGRFVDRQVLFNVVYAYKIRVVVQWIRTSTVGFYGISQVDRSTTVDEVLGTKNASYYLGDWSHWSKTEIVDNVLPDPPDELTVQPVSRKSEIRIAWRAPNNPQRDISHVSLVRAVIKNGSISDWTELGDFPPTNGQYFDRDVVVDELGNTEYVYAMYSSSFHDELSSLGDQMAARLAGPKSSHEYPLRRVAAPGRDPMAHPGITDDRESTDVIARGRLVMYCRSGTSGHPLRDRDYLLDVRSLSTGERVQVSLNVDSTEILSKDA